MKILTKKPTYRERKESSKISSGILRTSNEGRCKACKYKDCIQFSSQRDCLTPSYKRDKKVLFFGAGEGIRTLDFNLGKVALYP